jgi:branched-chain amino acid aminotransferase
MRDVAASTGQTPMVDKTEWIWQDGEFVAWDRATVHVLTHGLHYGFGAFEGIRAYRLDGGGSAVFRLEEHLRRLFDTMKILNLTSPFSAAALKEAVLELLTRNKLEEAYVRPIAFLGMGAMGLYAMNNPVQVVIAAFPWGAYLGEEGLRQGIKAKVSTFARNHVNSVMAKGKVCGHYVNNILAKVEAVAQGYQEAVMLDTAGYVAEASGENIFLVRAGAIATPPAAAVLGGITRDAVVRIAGDCGYTVIERPMARDELYIADEIFITGTAAEVTPVREVDERTIGTGEPGPVTRRIQETFFDAAKGRDTRYESWLTRLPAPGG